MSPLPPISSVPELPTESRAEILDTLFEPSTQLHTLSVSSLHETRFDSYDDLVDAVGSQMTGLLESDLSSDQRWLESILTAHPRLGEKRADTLSAHSRAEQAHLQQQQEEEGAKLAQLNRAYEDKFAGLIYVYALSQVSIPSRSLPPTPTTPHTMPQHNTTQHKQHFPQKRVLPFPLSRSRPNISNIPVTHPPPTPFCLCLSPTPQKNHEKCYVLTALGGKTARSSTAAPALSSCKT